MLLHSSFKDTPDKLFSWWQGGRPEHIYLLLGNFLLQFFYLNFFVETQIFCLPLSVWNPGRLLMQWDDLVHVKNAERSWMTALLTSLFFFFFVVVVCVGFLCVALSLLTLLGTISWLGLAACPSSGACSWSLTSGQPFYATHCMEEEWDCLTAGI